MEPVKSSVIAAVGYDSGKRILAVMFHTGHIVNYADVSIQMALDLVAAQSIGAYYSKHIRGKFSGRRMTGPCGNCGDEGYIGDTCTDCGTGQYVEAPMKSDGRHNP